MHLAWLSNPSVLWARTGLFHWWALTLLAFKDQPFMSVFLLLFPAPAQHLFLHPPCSNPVSFARDGVPMCRKPWQICWAESHPLKPIPSSVFAFPRLLSSLLQLLWVHSLPVQHWARLPFCSHPRASASPQAQPPARDKSRIYREMESKGHFLC